MAATSKPMMSLVSKIANRSPTVDSRASNRSGTLGTQSSSSDRTGIGKPVAKGLKENTGSSSQVWHQDENTNARLENPGAETRNRLSDTKLTHHNFQISNVGHLERESFQLYGRN